MTTKGDERSTVNLEFRRETLVDRIATILEQRILSGELVPNSKLSEPKVAAEFGVSRIPARESLQRLEEKNLVRLTHSGRVVNQFNRKDFQEIYELKNVVEAFGAMLGAKRANTPQLAQLQEVTDLMELQFQRGDLEALQLTNQKFHDLMVSFSKNEKVIESFTKLVKQVRWSTERSFRRPNRPANTIKEHREIFEAYKNRQGQKVRELLERHSTNNLQRILTHFDD
jgi:DNA-binding GntR family transcriptional regulator